MDARRDITLFAPAKINLYLQITARRNDGYHDLDSLAVFADIGDRIAIEPASDFQFAINGPFASAFTAKEIDSSPASSNLVVRAAWALAKAARLEPRLRMTLTKNLPLASGLGGGSADAAAVLWGLMDLWKIPLAAHWLPGLMTGLGADVPACLRCAPVRMTGTGDILDLVGELPEMPVLLVNPGKRCPTPEVFRRFAGPLRNPAALPGDLSSTAKLIAFLSDRENDLTGAALEIVPDIAAALQALGRMKGCALCRMSGSGASVFGLFETADDTRQAAEQISLEHPRWWVRVGTINRPKRY